ncbi:MAG: phage holin family protein [Acidobacteriota bacterium]|nr:phage holin family protein [Acidobacteriota bacterium]
MAERPSASDYLQVLKTTVPNMVDQIGELAKAELKPAAKHGGIGAGALGGAAVVGLTVLKLLMLTFAFALSMMYHELAGFNPLTALTLGFLTTAVLGLIIVAVFALFGRNQVMKVKAPSATIAEARASLGAITDAIENGVADARQQRVPTDAIEVTGSAKLPKRRTDYWSE